MRLSSEDVRSASVTTLRRASAFGWPSERAIDWVITEGCLGPHRRGIRLWLRAVHNWRPDRYGRVPQKPSREDEWWTPVESAAGSELRAAVCRGPSTRRPRQY